MKRMVICLLTALTMLFSLPAEARPLKTNRLYMFGFSASFKDSVVYVTDIQNVPGAWIDTKTGFLFDCEQYSTQLDEYLANEKKEKGRIPVVFFKMKKKKIEKQYMKLMKKYKRGYDVRYLNATQFKFTAIERNEE